MKKRSEMLKTALNTCVDILISAFVLYVYITRLELEWYGLLALGLLLGLGMGTLENWVDKKIWKRKGEQNEKG